MTLVFARNCALYFAVSTLFVWENMSDTDGETHKFCKKEFNITPGWVAPEDYSLTQMTSEFTEAWKTFHLSELWLVRMSHAILYPSILLLLARRRLTSFFIWVMFIEIDLFHMLADIVHYVSGPSLAEARLEFQGEAKIQRTLGDTPPAIDK